MRTWGRLSIFLFAFLIASSAMCTYKVSVSIVFSTSFSEVTPFSKEEARKLVLERLQQHGNLMIVDDRQDATDYIYVSFDLGADKSHFVMCGFTMVRAGLKCVLSSCGDISDECYERVDEHIAKLGIGRLKYGPFAFTGSFDEYEDTVRDFGMLMCYFFEP